jgi:hypothetical protein
MKIDVKTFWIMMAGTIIGTPLAIFIDKRYIRDKSRVEIRLDVAAEEVKDIEEERKVISFCSNPRILRKECREWKEKRAEYLRLSRKMAHQMKKTRRATLKLK